MRNWLEKTSPWVSKEIEGRVIRKLSKEISQTESRKLDPLSKFDEFLLNPQIWTCYVAVPGTSRDSDSEKRESFGARSLHDPCPEAVFCSHHSRNSNGSELQETHHSNSSSSHDNGKKIDTSLFVQKPCSITNYIKANTEENIGMKNQFRIKNPKVAICNREAASKNYVGKKFNNPSHVNFNDKIRDYVRFIKVNSVPAINQHITPKQNVDIAIDEPTLVRNNHDIDFNSFNKTNMNNITLITQALNDFQIITKAYVDQFHKDDERSRQNLGRFL